MKFGFAKAIGLCVGVGMGVAAAGSATAVTVTGVGFYPTEMITYEGSVTNGGSGPFTRPTGPIQINIGGSQTPVWVFCVDWDHEVDAGLGYQLATNDTYNLGHLTNDSTGVLSGNGNPLSLTVSGEIQTLLNLGVAAAASGNATDDELAAYQAAIWDIEYGLVQNPGDASASEIATIQADIAYAVANPYASYALAYFDANGASQALGTAVPEPAAWSLMLLGLGGLGGALRSRRRAVTA